MYPLRNLFRGRFLNSATNISTIKMINFAALLIVGVIAGQAYADAPEAIVGGNNAMLGQFPHQTSVKWRGEHICGGSIISPTHILTAAHCAEDPAEYPFFTVVTGAIRSKDDGETHKIKCITLHPDYNAKREEGWKNDIALITLEEPITFNENQKPIPLATDDYATGEFRGLISGWGRTSVNSDTPLLLQWLEVGIFSKARCLSAYPQNDYGGGYTTEKQICTLAERGRGACTGDSGGPLVVEKKLAGVTSWVMRCALGLADVFTKVSEYVDWIKEAQTMC